VRLYTNLKAAAGTEVITSIQMIVMTGMQVAESVFSGAPEQAAAGVLGCRTPQRCLLRLPALSIDSLTSADGPGRWV